MAMDIGFYENLLDSVYQRGIRHVKDWFEAQGYRVIDDMNYEQQQLDGDALDDYWQEVCEQGHYGLAAAERTDILPEPRPQSQEESYEERGYELIGKNAVGRSCPGIIEELERLYEKMNAVRLREFPAEDSAQGPETLETASASDFSRCIGGTYKRIARTRRVRFPR